MRQISLKFDSLSDMIRTACILEAAAPKAGNVHPEASFSDLSFDDFERAADVTAEELGNVTGQNVGPCMLAAIRKTRARTHTNVNLGIVLLLGPLAAVPANESLVAGVPRILARLTDQDSAAIYEAIHHAHPAGMGRVEQGDVFSSDVLPIQQAMALSAERDSIAHQYASGFAELLGFALDRLLNWIEVSSHRWDVAIVGSQLDLLSRQPDSLIARKCGESIAREVSVAASRVLDLGWPHSPAAQQAYEKFDRQLRSNGHRLNPGTTADWIAAILFAAIRERRWTPPTRIEVPLSCVTTNRDSLP